MIAHITYHYCVPGRVKTEIQALLENGFGARLWPGFVYRRTLLSQTDHLKVASLAVWRSVAEFEAWSSSMAHIRGEDYGLCSHHSQSEGYDVIPELLPSSIVGGKLVSISDRYVIAEHVDEGRRFILENGKGQRKYPGFVSHLSLAALEDPLKLTTVTVWKSSKEYESWRESPAHRRGSDYGLWSQPTVRELWELIPELPWTFSLVPGEGLRVLD